MCRNLPVFFSTPKKSVVTPKKAKVIAQSDAAANATHLLIGVRSSMENVEKKLDKQSEELKKLMLKVTAIQEVLDTTMLAKEELADTFAFAPAKNEDELAIVISKLEAELIVSFPIAFS